MIKKWILSVCVKQVEINTTQNEYSNGHKRIKVPIKQEVVTNNQ